MQGHSNHGNESSYVFRTGLESRFDVEAAAYGRVASRKEIFIQAHRFLLVLLVFLSMKPLAVAHFYAIKPLYDIPEQLLNLIAHL
jgi:hypothetical protein